MLQNSETKENKKTLLYTDSKNNYCKQEIIMNLINQLGYIYIKATNLQLIKVNFKIVNRVK